jgi:hypothetical protein
MLKAASPRLLYLERLSLLGMYLNDVLLEVGVPKHHVIVDKCVYCFHAKKKKGPKDSWLLMKLYKAESPL